MQKQRRRNPRQWPPLKPSVWQTEPQLLLLKHNPLNRWLCDSQVLASATISVAKIIINIRRIVPTTLEKPAIIGCISLPPSPLTSTIHHQQNLFTIAQAIKESMDQVKWDYTPLRWRGRLRSANVSLYVSNAVDFVDLEHKLQQPTSLTFETLFSYSVFIVSGILLLALHTFGYRGRSHLSVLTVCYLR